jgi:hypothetical protein
MKPLLFMELSEAGARRYLDHVIARGPVRLQDLAFHMRDTGGPVNQLNASVESLGPLWEWYLKRFEAGLPEVDPSARPSVAITLNLPMSEEMGRATYAVEPFAHYLFEIIRTFDPHARWDLFPIRSKDDSARNEPAILSDIQLAIPAEEIVMNLAYNLIEGRPAVTGKDGFIARFQRLVTITKPAVSPHSTSILSPLLQLPRVPAEDPARKAPRALTDASPQGEDEVGGNFIIARGGDYRELHVGEAINPTALAHWMRDVGIHFDGVPVTDEMLLRPDTQLIYGDSLILLEPLFQEGSFVAVSVEPIHISKPDWMDFASKTESEMKKLGLAFGPSENLIVE